MGFVEGGIQQECARICFLLHKTLTLGSCGTKDKFDTSTVRNYNKFLSVLTGP